MTSFRQPSALAGIVVEQLDGIATEAREVRVTHHAGVASVPERASQAIAGEGSVGSLSFVGQIFMAVMGTDGPSGDGKP